MAIACIIDDDPIQSLLVERMLYKQKLCKGLYVYTNGLEAITHLRAIVNDPALFPDVIFLDINMPVMDGWEFLEEFKGMGVEVKKKVRVFMLSSSIWQEDIDRANSYTEVSDYLLKPLSMSRLSEAMANANLF